MRRNDDLLVGVALVAVALVCVVFRYLPMVDLPQHYAMVSIMRHHGDPAWGFAQRYTFDFLGRPYATVYFLATALSWVMPLGAAMRITVALCVVAPFAGLWALMHALDRPRAWVLAVIPFAFGALFHWGFLNFLLGTGVFVAGLALVVRAASGEGRWEPWALLALGPFALLTHFHSLVMLLVTAPLFAFGWARDRDLRRAARRVVLPLVPGGLLAVLFVALTWRQAEGAWAVMNPGFSERVSRFVEFLAGGLPEDAALGFVLALAALAIAALLLGEHGDRRQGAVLLAALLLQVVGYFALPLNTNTATFVSARHALLIVLFVVPLLPDPEGARGLALRALAGVAALAGLLVIGRQLACFDREARDVDAVLDKTAPARRMLPLIFARGSACCDPRAFPYLHFAAYYQAARGGELSRSFAVVWNVPIRYRADYHRWPIRELVEWAPQRVSPDDVAHFDYVLLRGGGMGLPQLARLHEVARSGAWTLLENPEALPAELPR